MTRTPRAARTRKFMPPPPASARRAWPSRCRRRSARARARARRGPSRPASRRQGEQLAQRARRAPPGRPAARAAPTPASTTSGSPTSSVATTGTSIASASLTTTGIESRSPSAATTHGIASTVGVLEQLADLVRRARAGELARGRRCRARATCASSSLAQRAVADDRLVDAARRSSAAASTRCAKPFFSTSRPTATTCRPPGCGGAAPEALAVDAHHDLVDPPRPGPTERAGGARCTRSRSSRRRPRAACARGCSGVRKMSYAWAVID